ncbi:hypothetical protein CW304_32115 [Bacillus sp. UFRGS-B20]|nr:hypothetical protein CW304_32115 [Bacillus sp. UFRGS-B20]
MNELPGRRHYRKSLVEDICKEALGLAENFYAAAKQPANRFFRPISIPCLDVLRRILTRPASRNRPPRGKGECSFYRSTHSSDPNDNQRAYRYKITMRYGRTSRPEPLNEAVLLNP